MKYRNEETLYGPGIRFNDWRMVSGEKTRAGGAVLFTGGSIEAIRDDYPYGGGGDVSHTMSFCIEPVAGDGARLESGPKRPSWSVEIHLNYFDRDPDNRGFRIIIGDRSVTVDYRGAIIGRSEIDVSAGEPLSLVCATLDERFSIVVGGHAISKGHMVPPYNDNEGWVRIAATGADVRLFEYIESAIVDDDEIPTWERGELLYREAFDPATFATNWFVNADKDAPETDLETGRFIFRHMSNALLRRRFEGPIIVDYAAKPIPTDEFSSGVTDAIFIWMAESSAGDLIEMLEEQNRLGVASLPMLLPHPFYWVDFGGTNNNTTRLRKNPHRHLMRQYTDRPRLLAPDHTYSITAVQNGEYIEFHVDGEPMIRCRDPHPLTSGYIGIRSYVADLELTGLSVYRVRS